MNTNTTPSGADALDVAMSKACIHSWDQSQFTSGDCDAVHPMFSRAFEAGYRAALSAAEAQASGQAAPHLQSANCEQDASQAGFAWPPGPTLKGVTGEMTADDIAMGAAAPAAQGEPAVSAGDALPTVHSTAPERIYLCIGDEAEQRDAPFDELADITWSHDQPVDVTVPYVRADLASATAPLMARIAEIEAELEKTKAIFAASCNHAAVMEMDRDARRYRWLRKRWARLDESYADGGPKITSLRVLTDQEVQDGYGWDVDPECLDAAIDAAMKEEGHG